MAQGGAVVGWHPVNSLAQAIACGVAALLVLLGMAVAGMLVLLAQIEMLLGAAVAPLLLPGLAFGLTSQLGWGAVYDLVRGAVRVIATGAAVDAHGAGGGDGGRGARDRPGADASPRWRS